MDPLTLGAIGLIGGTLSSVFTSSNQYYNDMRKMRYQSQINRELADHTFGQNLWMWNKQNAYNSPKEQMKRMREAGLNPALMYDSVQSNTAGPVTYQEAPVDVPSKRAVNPLDQLGILSLFQDLDLKSAQVDTQKSQAGYYDALANKANVESGLLPEYRTAQVGNLNSMSRQRDFALQVSKEFKKYDEEAKKLSNKLLQGKIDLIDYDKELKDALTNLYDSETYKNDQITPYLVGTQEEKMKFQKEYNEKILPLQALILETKAKEDYANHLITRQTLESKIAKIHAEYRKVKVDISNGSVQRQIAEQMLENYQAYGVPYDPITVQGSSLVQGLMNFYNSMYPGGVRTVTPTRSFKPKLK